VSPPVVPLLVTAGLLAAGGVAYSLTGAARAYRPMPVAADARRRTGQGSPRTWLLGSAVSAPGVAAVLLVIAAMSVGFGQLDTSLAATAVEVLGDPGRLGILFAAIAGGSVIGGLSYGARHWTGPEHRRLPVTLTTFAAALVPIPILFEAGYAPLVLLLPLLFVAGLSIAPSLIIAQNMLDELAPAHRVNEAQSLLTAAATSGAAAGTAAAGALVDLGGPPWSFAGAVVAVAAAAVLAATSQRRWTAASTEATSAAPV
jgi:predicted MFS family arabinose efflux permease